MRSFILPFLTVLLFTLGCNDQPASESADQDSQVETKKRTGPVKPEDLPSMPGIMITRLMEELDNIDYQFNELPISMNMNTSSAIRQSLSHIANQRVRDSEGCKPAGKIWYGREGEIVLEAEFFVGPVCNFFVFSEKGEKKWANEMTPQGATFFKLTKQRAGFE